MLEYTGLRQAAPDLVAQWTTTHWKIDDQYYEPEDEDGEITVKSGGSPRDILEKRARDALKANEASKKKRFVTMINRRICDILKHSNLRGSLLQVQ